MKSENYDLVIVGLGYVGLPLAVEFGKIRPVMGYDRDPERLTELQRGHDRTLEVSGDDLGDAVYLSYIPDISNLRKFDVTGETARTKKTIFIVSVPTPLTENKAPDLDPLIKASSEIGKILKKGDIVIYESTVYPGCTEEICVPVLEKYSSLKYLSSEGDTLLDVDDAGFYCGYSPERINPGDREHRLTSIKKITSGSTKKAAEIVDELYGLIISAGTHKAASIKIAEAAKVIENTQRDVNIALVNEFAIIFDRLGIDSGAVLQAAATKWNFLSFRPGLVGGHCIGVDPYYLTHKAEQSGYSPQVILAGRRLNDEMGHYVATKFTQVMQSRRNKIEGLKVLVMGLTFKENCPDIRNSLVFDVVGELASSSFAVDIYDPWVDPLEIELGSVANFITEIKTDYYDGIIVAVAHREFIESGDQIKNYCKRDAVIYDVKRILPLGVADISL